MPDITTLVTTDGHLLKRSGTTITGVDPASLSGTLLAVTSYNPATETAVTTTSATFADIDATNLAVTFTAPASGTVIVTLDALLVAGTTTTLHWNLRSAGADVAGTQKRMAYNGPSNQIRGGARIRVAGLTAGSSYTYTWGHARTVGTDNAQTIYGGTVGAAIMEVWAA